MLSRSLSLIRCEVVYKFSISVDSGLTVLRALRNINNSMESQIFVLAHTKASKWYKIIACVGSSHLGIKWIYHWFWNGVKNGLAEIKYYECCCTKRTKTKVHYVFVVSLASHYIHRLFEFSVSRIVFVGMFVWIEFIWKEFCTFSVVVTLLVNWWQCPKTFALIHYFVTQMIFRS